MFGRGGIQAAREDGGSRWDDMSNSGGSGKTWYLVVSFFFRVGDKKEWTTQTR